MDPDHEAFWVLGEMCRVKVLYRRMVKTNTFTNESYITTPPAWHYKQNNS